jgi:hypothetical protein
MKGLDHELQALHPSDGSVRDETLFRLTNCFPRIAMTQGMRMEAAHRRQSS